MSWAKATSHNGEFDGTSSKKTSFHWRRLLAILAASLYVILEFDVFAVFRSTGFRSTVLTHQANAPHNKITIRFHSAPPGSEPLRNASMGGAYKCLPTLNGNTTRIQTLPPFLRDAGLFDFATTIHTDLKILFIGDSVAQQLSEAMDESLGIQFSWNHNDTMFEKIGYRKLLDQGQFNQSQEILSISSPANGGGISSYWRMTDIWSEETKGNPLPPSALGGWDDHQSALLLNELPSADQMFDAVILMYNSWIMPVDPSVEDRYRDAIRLTRQSLGAKVLILVTYPSTRRVNSTSLWKNVTDTNHMLRRISAENNEQHENGKQNPLTLVLEFGNLTNQIQWSNAFSFGMNVSNPREISHLPDWELLDDASLLFQRIKFCIKDGCNHMTTICSERVSETSNCIRNFISFDDTHWCTETIGARFSAGVACLLACAFESCGGEGSKSVESMSACETKCNNQFMALNPITDLLNGTSTFSTC